MGDTVNSLEPLTVSWDPSCLSTDKQIDIILLAPYCHFLSPLPLGEYLDRRRHLQCHAHATLVERNQLAVTANQHCPRGNATFLSDFPAGPIFTATYTEPASGMPASANVNIIDSGVTVVNTTSTGMNPGKTAAAVLLPLLSLSRASAVTSDSCARRALRSAKSGLRPWISACLPFRSTGSPFPALGPTPLSVPPWLWATATRLSRSELSGHPAPSPSKARIQATMVPHGRCRRCAPVSACGIPLALARLSVFRVYHLPLTPVSPASPSPTPARLASLGGPGLSTALTSHLSLLSLTTLTVPRTMPWRKFSPRQTQGPIALTPEDIHTIPTAQNNENNGSDLADFMPALSSKIFALVVLRKITDHFSLQ